ncbi:Eco47II family restriction endonuclease [Candidatus Uhrbacteria bacterium]|nr:Eco47II family restriction endonuclease [Candidatus Uhrbacteria bacterium]
MHKNIIDPFSAVIDASFHGISLQEWTNFENVRQIQKSMQNALGRLYQEILGSVSGWQSRGVGDVLDLESTQYKILAEVKSKFNITKGSDTIKNLR